MTKPTFKQLKSEVDIVLMEYQEAFAGKSRVTRDLGHLDRLIARLESVAEQGKSLLNGSRDPALLSLLDTVSNSLDTYAGERQAIAEAQAQGPEVVDLTNLAMWANLVFAKYTRHFAGKNRRTRDLGLLDEMIEQLEKLHKDMVILHEEVGTQEVANNVTVIERNLKLYKEERVNILDSRAQGTHEERSDALATRANEQFFIYRDFFAGKSRLSRRPQRLARVIQQLQEISAEMKALSQQVDDSSRIEKNMEIVASNLAMYQNELQEVEKAQANLSAEDYAGHLGAAANEVIDAYRENFAGKDRASRDLDLLSTLCDQLDDVSLQMHALLQTNPDEVTTRNLVIVLDSRNLYEMEYRHIQEAKAKNQ